jgi:hypothetical protein
MRHVGADGRSLLSRRHWAVVSVPARTLLGAPVLTTTRPSQVSRARHRRDLGPARPRTSGYDGVSAAVRSPCPRTRRSRGLSTPYRRRGLSAIRDGRHEADAAVRERRTYRLLAWVLVAVHAAIVPTRRRRPGCDAGASRVATRPRVGVGEGPCELAVLAPGRVSRAPRRAARCVSGRGLSVGRPPPGRSTRRLARPPTLRACLRGSASWPPPMHLPRRVRYPRRRYRQVRDTTPVW